MQYSTDREVKLLDRRLGLLHLSIFTLILAYVLGVRIGLHSEHLAVELSEGSVDARLEGLTFSSARDGAHPSDTVAILQSSAGPSSLFIPTRSVSTRIQRQGNCTDAQQPCAVDADCSRMPPLAYGLCEKGACVRLGWCPREQPQQPEVSELVTLQASGLLL